MRIPVIKGIIKRRLLLNYRVDADVAEKLLPAGFRPKLINGYAIAGICLIRLEKIRPVGLPGIMGISNENMAHRIAVEWVDKEGKECAGVYIPRRDTDSRLNSLAGGRIFPGVHHLAHFSVNDLGGPISMRVNAYGSEEALLEVEANETDTFTEGSIFSSLEEASVFAEKGCIGYSARPDSCRLDGLLLKVKDWQVTPLEILSLRSVYYDDESLFPAGSIQFDHALLMRNIPHEWHSQVEMEAGESKAVGE